MTSYRHTLAALAKRHGWRMERSAGGHLRLRHTGTGRSVFAASTPSDHRAIMNVAAEMRRAIRTAAPPHENGPAG